MKVCVIDHQNVGNRLAALLLEAGVELVPHPFSADVLLVDYPTGWGGEKLLYAQEAARRGVVVVGFPHGARPLLEYDGITPAPDFMRAELVPAAGHAEVYRRMGYPVPAVPIGWFMCEPRPPRDSLIRSFDHLLFAPIHPNSGDGGKTGLPWAHELNRRALQAVFAHEAPRTTIRMYGTLEGNFGDSIAGLWSTTPEALTVVDAQLDLSHADIDAADAVVSFGTYAWLAVARGKPTVFMGQNQPPMDDWGRRTVNDFGAYGPYLRYPYDLDDGPFDEVLAAACAGGPDLNDWRQRFIGEPCDPQKLAAVLRGFVAERVPNRAARRARKKHGRR